MIPNAHPSYFYSTDIGIHDQNTALYKEQNKPKKNRGAKHKLIF